MSFYGKICKISSSLSAEALRDAFCSFHVSSTAVTCLHEVLLCSPPETGGHFLQVHPFLLWLTLGSGHILSAISTFEGVSPLVQAAFAPLCRDGPILSWAASVLSAWQLRAQAHSALRLGGPPSLPALCTNASGLGVRWSLTCAKCQELQILSHHDHYFPGRFQKENQN